MSSTKLTPKQLSWSSIIRDPAISKLLVNMAFSGLSYGVYNNLIYFFIPYLDKGVDSIGHFALQYLVFQIAMSLALPIGGYLTDKMGRKPVLMMGSTAVALGTFVLPLATEWWHIIYFSIGTAIGYALVSVAQNCVVADVTAEYRREKAYSITMSFSMVFGVIGTVALIIYSFLYDGVLPNNTYYFLPSVSAAILAVLAAVPLFLIRIPRQPPKDGPGCAGPPPKSDSSASDPVNTLEQKQLNEPPRNPLRNSVVLKILIFQGVIGFGAGFLVPLFNYFWRDLFKLPQPLIYTIALLGELGVAVGGLIAPMVSRRAKRLGGRVGTTIACQVASIACAAYLATVPYYLFLLPAVLAFIARQALMNMVSPLMSALTMDHTPVAQRGRVNSLTQLIFNVPNGISTNLSGRIIGSVPGNYGYTYSTLILVGTYICGTALLSTTRKKDRLLVKQWKQAKE
ncbi:MAG: MFS transporter [Promethearchaeati archaeon SRVP18_Atabeyarchaeia-1]